MEFPYTLYHDECLNAMSAFAVASIDLVFCDLPYGTTNNAWDTIIPLDRLWEQYVRILKPNGAIVLTAQAPFDKVLACSNLSLFKYEWIWHKNKATGHLNANRMPLKAHENVLVFYAGAPTYHPQKTNGHKPMNPVSQRADVPRPEVQRNYGHVKRVLGNPGGTTIRFPRTVIDIPVINNDNPLKIHPTQKPVELAEYFIRTYTNANDTVLDNCMGSGSTGIACLNTGRCFVGIEQNDEYFAHAHQWISSHKVLPIVEDVDDPVLQNSLDL